MQRISHGSSGVMVGRFGPIRDIPGVSYHKNTIRVLFRALHCPLS